MMGWHCAAAQLFSFRKVCLLAQWPPIPRRNGRGPFTGGEGGREEKRYTHPLHPRPGLFGLSPGPDRWGKGGTAKGKFSATSSRARAPIGPAEPSCAARSCSSRHHRAGQRPPSRQVWPRSSVRTDRPSGSERRGATRPLPKFAVSARGWFPRRSWNGPTIEGVGGLRPHRRCPHTGPFQRENWRRLRSGARSPIGPSPYKRWPYPSRRKSSLRSNKSCCRRCRLATGLKSSA
jgi:hypothetical protein